MDVPRTRFTSVARKSLYRRARAPLAPMVPTPMRLFGAYPVNATVATTETASTTSANRDSKQHANIQAAGRASYRASRSVGLSHGGGVD